MCHLQTPTALSHGEFDSRLRKSLSEERVATLIPGVYPHLVPTPLTSPPPNILFTIGLVEKC